MITNYIDKINKRYGTGISTEHSYRGDLQTLLESFDKSVMVTNEPSRIECGAPDYIVTKKNVPVGYIEAKDIGVPLKKIDKTDQLKRYKSSLGNLILTDYLVFRLYRNGRMVTSVAIAEIRNKRIEPLPDSHEDFENLVRDFYTHLGQTITSPSNLAEMMAGKAGMMQSVIEKAVTGDEENDQDSTLKDQMLAFRKILIHDIRPSEFADIYAQTIAYGMFAACLRDKAPEKFSRREAADLIPKSNPFLRRLFGYIAGPDIDDRIKWIVDALSDIFRATDLAALMKNFGSSTQTNDPVIHFYETFLAKYNPKLRKKRGVWYTPEPVVSFIVRAADDILKTEFGLPAGLADTSKIRIKAGEQGVGGKVRKEVHKVQILDPAAGTGTFLAEVVRQIHKKFRGQQGIWSGYVEEHLIPRLTGFEILMASYTMAHLKLDLLLGETGYKPKKQSRFRIFLTNSLEEVHPDTGTLFTTWLSNEATEANLIKRDTPVMVILGNPPYSGESANKGEWINRLMEDYKKEPGGKQKLKEKNSKWINDDYVKFLRYGQYFIEKNGEGMLAFVNPHGFLDNPTFRGMRWNLLKAYDKIYVIDLHGNSKKREVCPDGSPDINVFDIQQGVSINLFVKTGKKKASQLGKVFHCDLYGKREYKYDFLLQNSIKQVDFKELPNVKSNYFFVQKAFKAEKKYGKGFSVAELFTVNSVGIVTARDNFTIQETREEVTNIVNDFVNLEIEEARTKYALGKDVRDWKVQLAQEDLRKSELNEDNVCKISYRPFDDRWTYYTGKSKGFHCMPRGQVMQHLLRGENVGLALCRQFKTGDQYVHSFITKQIIESSYVSNRTSEITSMLPLYLYPETDGQQTFDDNKDRKPNLNDEIVRQIADGIGLIFTHEKEKTKNTFAPIDILDYIYAVLHSPAYREKYKEFLKTDFPRVPYPRDKKTFRQLIKLGGELRTIHLLENPKVEQFVSSYPKDGDNVISRKIVKKDFEITDRKKQLGRVRINDEQYFGNVPKAAWEFYIGGYQPAQKWLKDRKGRELSSDDILHYQKIIVALSETGKLMKKIDKTDFM
ncbi:N-6 DNA methylase [Desulfobacterales bacterium HSG2]|nr:N-6 DNA methylase [Desulfobacterales bacterium HSG2]